MDLADVMRLLAALEERGVRYALFGGLAMAAHGLDRATRDIDLFVEPSSGNVARLGEAFAFDDLEVERLRAGDVDISVVSPRTLYEMKRDTVRPRDADDAARLRARFRMEG